MPALEFFRDQIEKELATARAAASRGNDGMARVAARRAAGLAIGWHAQESASGAWGTDAMTRLRHAAQEEALPEGVRGAAARLSAKISARFSYPSSAHPVDDALVIIRHFMAWP